MFRGERGILQVSRPRRRPSRPMGGLAVVRRMLRLVVGCVQTSSAEPGWYLRVVICQWHKQADLFGSGAAASCLPAGHGNFSALVGSVGPSLRRVQHCDWPVPPTTQCPGGGTGRTTPASCSISHCLAPFLGGFGGAGAPGRSCLSSRRRLVPGATGLPAAAEGLGVPVRPPVQKAWCPHCPPTRSSGRVPWLQRAVDVAPRIARPCPWLGLHGHQRWRESPHLSPVQSSPVPIFAESAARRASAMQCSAAQPRLAADHPLPWLVPRLSPSTLEISTPSSPVRVCFAPAPAQRGAQKQGCQAQKQTSRLSLTAITRFLLPQPSRRRVPAHIASPARPRKSVCATPIAPISPVSVRVPPQPEVRPAAKHARLGGAAVARPLRPITSSPVPTGHPRNQSSTNRETVESPSLVCPPKTDPSLSCRSSPVPKSTPRSVVSPATGSTGLTLRAAAFFSLSFVVESRQGWALVLPFFPRRCLPSLGRRSRAASAPHRTSVLVCVERPRLTAPHTVSLLRHPFPSLPLLFHDLAAQGVVACALRRALEENTLALELGAVRGSESRGARPD